MGLEAALDLGMQGRVDLEFGMGRAEDPVLEFGEALKAAFAQEVDLFDQLETPGIDRVFGRIECALAYLLLVVEQTQNLVEFPGIDRLRDVNQPAGL